MSIRPVQPSDLDAINALYRSVWWPERSAEGWKWLWSNPIAADHKADHGWVIDAGDGPAACAGNFIQRFWQGDQIFYGATGYSIVVPPTQRGRSRDLVRAFVDQPGCFAKYTFNANARSSPLYKRFRMTAWPPETHDIKLSWLVAPLACLYGRGLRHVVDHAPRVASLLGEQLSPFPRLAPAWSRHRAESRMSPHVSVIRDPAGDPDYARFWEALRREGRLIADRSPEILRWRLSDPDLTVPPLALAHRSQGGITGFALAMLNKQTPLDPPVLEVIDLVGLSDSPDAIPALVQGLRALAPTFGAAKLRLQTVSPQILKSLGSLADKAHREGGWGHCHVAFDAGMQDAGWSPTPYDGDYSFCLRPLPHRASAALRLAAGPVRRQEIEART